MLSFRRARRHAAVLAAVAAVAAAVTAASFTIVGALGAAADDGVRLGLASRSGADLALRASIPLTSDPLTQDEQVRDAIGRSFASVTAPLQVTRTVSAELDLRAAAASDEERAGLVASIPELESVATLDAGRWPTAPDEVTMQADAAERLGAEPGDGLIIAGTPVTLVGVWRVADALDPRWLGDPQVLSGRGSRVGPVVVDEAIWASVPDAKPAAQWTIVPDASRLSATDLATIVPAWSRLTSDWRGHVDELGSIGKTGGLAMTATAMQERVDGMRAIEPVVLLLILAAALVTLAELARLLAADRSSEIALLWSRGRSSGETALAAGGELALTAAAGALVGAVAGAGATLLLGGEPTAFATSAVVVVPVLLVAAAAASGALSALRSSRPDARAGSAESRTRRLAGPGVAVLVGAAAAVSVWQLRLYGTPVTPLSDGSSAIDPVAVVAPALALLALVLLGLLLFPAVARLGERATTGSPVTRMLAARGVARRLPRVAALVVVVAVAAGTTTIAAVYAGTWSTAFDRTSALRAGADVSVVGVRGGIAATELDALAALPAASGAAPVHSSAMQLSDETGSLVAVAPDAFADLSTSAGGALDTSAIADAIRGEVASVEVPAGVDAVVVEARATSFEAVPGLSVQLVDDRGRLTRVTADARETDGRLSYAFAIPRSGQDRGARVLAVDVVLDADAIAAGATATFVLTGWRTDAGQELADASGLFWFPMSLGVDISPAVPFEGTGFAADTGTRSTRLLPGTSGGTLDLDRPGIAVSQALADRYDLEVGDPFSFGSEGTYARVDAVVVAIMAAVPSAGSDLAALIDLTVVQRTALEVSGAPPVPTGAWISSDDPRAAAAQARDVLPPNTRIRLADDPAGRTVIGAAAVALGVAALLCGLLAIVTLLAVSRAERRDRAVDVDVLRALGLRSGEQARLRRAEWWFVVGFGALTGFASGLAVAALTVPQLANAAVPDPYPGVDTALAVDLGALAVGTVLLVLACGAVIEAAAAQVARRARTVRQGDAR